MKNEVLKTTQQELGESNLINKEQIVQDIINSSTEQSDSDDKSSSLVKISYGSKDMTLKLRSGMAVSGGLLVTTYIENTRPTDKMEMETSLLYLATKDILQKFADNKQKSIYYMFDTENPRMMEWAKTKGQDIFNWDKKEIESENEGRGVFTKIFQPKKE